MPYLINKIASGKKDLHQRIHLPKESSCPAWCQGRRILWVTLAAKATPTLAMLIFTSTFLVLSGCAPPQPAQQLHQDIQQLSHQIELIRTEQERSHSRWMELNNRVTLLEDRLDSAQFAMRRSTRERDLPVTRLQPEGGSYSRLGPSTVSSRPAASRNPHGKQNDDLVVISNTNTNTDRSSPRQQPSSPRSEPDWQQADRRGIHVHEDLPVTPLPSRTPNHPPPTVPPSHRNPSATGRPTPGSASPPPPPPAAPARSALPKDPAAAYRMAFSTLQEGRLHEAQELFAEFAKRWPSHRLTDNAIYWRGECYYALGDYEQALVHFKDVIENHPLGNKVPDSLLKLGLSYYNLGEEAIAIQVIEQLLDIYPDGEVATTARERLEMIR